MEQDIAILVADLSGYTSLTDTHGAIAAADLVDKYMAFVENSLVGKSEFHQRTGDEVLIISLSADDLLCSAIALIEKTSMENEFLQIHGGLHYGKVLKRNNHYFGNTINLASRIASKASSGTLWCSEDFINALENRGSIGFEARGEHDFKNLRDKNTIYELMVHRSETVCIDPVCKMQINDKTNALAHPTKPDLFFCSKSCLEIYLEK
jgi:class 3 adenylate cyclase/YHS domain-containing protein